MKALVTGGAGFIGSTLVDRLLAEGHAVDVVDDLSTGSLANLADGPGRPHNELTFHQLDIRDAGAGRPHRAAASPRWSSTSPPRPTCGCRWPTRCSTPRSTSSAASTCSRGRGAAGSRKVVFASSGGTIYGEPDAVRPAGQGVAPAAAAVALRRRQEGRSATTCTPTASCTSSSTPRSRWPTSTGPARTPTARPAWWRSSPARLLAGEPCTIFGDGAQTRDFVFVDDVVDAFVRAAERGERPAAQHRHRAGDLGQRAATASWPGPPACRRRPRSRPARSGELDRSCLTLLRRRTLTRGLTA